LRAEGCTQVQGYLFSKPRPAAEVPEMIKEIEPKSRIALVG
jgi:EAL domain-containing protein (putative c-di-GMP-specific phosphodiesterase class I)